MSQALVDDGTSTILGTPLEVQVECLRTFAGTDLTADVAALELPSCSCTESTTPPHRSTSPGGPPPPCWRTPGWSPTRGPGTGLTSFYPVICTPVLPESHAFYVEHFDLATTFISDWYVSLRRRAEPGYELALLDHRHPTLPQAYRRPVQGVLLNIEVDDVDAEYQRLVRDHRLQVELPIRTETFGQRHFIVAAPDGVLVDVITPIEPGPDYADAFLDPTSASPP